MHVLPAVVVYYSAVTYVYVCALLPQVHCAVLWTGEKVAVKVQRPGLKQVGKPCASSPRQQHMQAQASWRMVPCLTNSSTQALEHLSHQLKHLLHVLVPQLFDIDLKNLKLLAVQLDKQDEANR